MLHIIRSRIRPTSRISSFILRKKPVYLCKLTSYSTQQSPKKKIETEILSIPEKLKTFRELYNVGNKPSLQLIHELLTECGRNAQLGYALETLELLEDMDYKPNIQTFNNILNASAKLGSYKTCLEIFQIMESYNIKPDSISYQLLIQGYSNAGQMAEAKKIFEELKLDPKIRISIRICAEIIFGCAKVGDWEYSLNLIKTMEKEFGIKPNIYCYNSTLHVCLMEEQYDQIESILNLMKEHNQKIINTNTNNNNNMVIDVDTFITMLSWFHKRKQYQNVIDFYEYMKLFDYIIPNTMIYNMVLNSLSKIKKDTPMKRTFKAQLVFEEMVYKHKIKPDVKTFTFLMNNIGASQSSPASSASFSSKKSSDLAPSLSLSPLLSPSPLSSSSSSSSSSSLSSSSSSVQQCTEIYQLMISDKYNIEPTVDIIITLISIFGRNGFEDLVVSSTHNNEEEEEEEDFDDDFESYHHDNEDNEDNHKKNYNNNNKEVIIKKETTISPLDYIFDIISKYNIKPNIILFNTILIACKNNNKYELAIKTLDIMYTYRIGGNFITFRLVIELLENNLKNNKNEDKGNGSFTLEQLYKIINDAIKNKVITQETWKVKIKKMKNENYYNYIDFETFSLPLSKALIRYLLYYLMIKHQPQSLTNQNQNQNIQKKKNQNNNQNQNQYQDIVLIVGNGKLKHDIIQFLKEINGPEVTMDSANNSEPLISIDEILLNKQEQQNKSQNQKQNNKKRYQKHEEYDHENYEEYDVFESEGGKEYEEGRDYDEIKEAQGFLKKKINSNRCLVLTKKDIEKYVYFNTVKEPAIMKLLPKWVYF